MEPLHSHLLRGSLCLDTFPRCDGVGNLHLVYEVVQMLGVASEECYAVISASIDTCLSLRNVELQLQAQASSALLPKESVFDCLAVLDPSFAAQTKLPLASSQTPLLRVVCGYATIGLSM